MDRERIERALENLREVRLEISRVNQARGETVFNPAATNALDEEIGRLEQDLMFAED